LPGDKEKKMTKAKPGIGTIAVHAGQVADPTTNSRAVPIYQTTSYVFNSAEHAANLFSLQEFGNIYTRLMNPTTDVLEKRVAELEGGVAALATSSGMSAITLAIHNIVGVGDHIVASGSLYGGTETLFHHTFPKLGIEVTLLDEPTPENYRKAARDNTRAFYGETIGNPKGDVLDIAGVAAVAGEAGVPLIIDNTFAPILCRPLEHGANIVVHSTTKWLGGHGTSIGGVIVDGGNFDWTNGKYPEFTEPVESYHLPVGYVEALKPMGNIAYIIKARTDGLRNLGMCQSPFNAFLTIIGIETIHLRMARHCENAIRVAEFLQQHPQVAWVNYTGLPDHPYHEIARKYLTGGFGAVLGFGVKGGLDAAKRVIEKVELCSHLANVGDAKTLVLHPASTSHQQMDSTARQAAGVTDDFIRVSVGIEDADDIIADLQQALD